MASAPKGGALQWSLVTFSPTYAPKRLEVGASFIQAYIAGGTALMVTALYAYSEAYCSIQLVLQGTLVAAKQWL